MKIRSGFKVAVAAAALTMAGLTVAVPANAATSGVQAVGTCTTATTFTVVVSGVTKRVNVPTTAGGKRDCQMQQGNVSGAVNRLQSNLRTGCEQVSPGPAVDGNFGPGTKAALQQAQRNLGVTADGIYGTQTASRMNWLTTDGSLCYRFPSFN